MTTPIEQLDAKIQKLRTQRRALAERDRKKRESLIQQLARKHGVSDLPPEQLAALFERLAREARSAKSIPEKPDAQA